MTQCGTVFVVWAAQYWRVLEYAGVLIRRENAWRKVIKLGEKARFDEIDLGRKLGHLRVSTGQVRH